MPPHEFTWGELPWGAFPWGGFDLGENFVPKFTFSAKEITRQFSVRERLDVEREDYEVFAKEPFEEWFLSFDFSRKMKAGATIVTVGSTASAILVLTGGDSTFDVLGGAQFINQKVAFKVKGGNDGDQHKITFRITDTEEEKHEGGLILEIRER